MKLIIPQLFALVQYSGTWYTSMGVISSLSEQGSTCGKAEYGLYGKYIMFFA
jgi:hypothetical protein